MSAAGVVTSILPLAMLHFNPGAGDATEIRRVCSDLKVTGNIDGGGSADWHPLPGMSGRPASVSSMSGEGARVTVGNYDWAFGQWIQTGMLLDIYIGSRVDIDDTSVAWSRLFLRGVVDNVRIAETVVFECRALDLYRRCPTKVAMSKYAVEPGEDLIINGVTVRFERPR